MHKDLFRFVAAIVFGVMVMHLTGCVIVDPRPWTKKEKGLLVSSLVASAADAYTTTRLDFNGPHVENNFILGPHPSDGEVVLYFSVTTTGAVVVSHYWPDARPWILGGMTGLNGYGAVNNYRLKERYTAQGIRHTGEE